jgi:hypothetical protein
VLLVDAKLLVSTRGGGHSLYSGIRVCAAHVGRLFRIFGIWVGRLFSILGIWVSRLFIILVFGWVDFLSYWYLGGSQKRKIGIWVVLNFPNTVVTLFSNRCRLVTGVITTRTPVSSFSMLLSSVKPSVGDLTQLVYDPGFMTQEGTLDRGIIN